MRGATAGAMKRLENVPDPIPARIAARNGMPDATVLKEVLARVHGADGARALPQAKRLRAIELLGTRVAPLVRKEVQ